MAGSDFLVIGKIVGVHGIRGEAKIQPYVEDRSFFQPGTALRIEGQSAHGSICVITGSRPHKQNILLMLEGIGTRSEAEALIGTDILIPKDELPGLEEGTYYWFEMIGLDVYTPEDIYLGRLESIFPTGSNDVYVVRNPQTHEEKLIPALRSVIIEIDLDAKKMRVDLPEGL